MADQRLVFINTFSQDSSSAQSTRDQRSRSRDANSANIRKRSRARQASAGQGDDAAEVVTSTAQQTSTFSNVFEFDQFESVEGDKRVVIRIPPHFGFYRSELLDLFPWAHDPEVGHGMDVWIHHPDKYNDVPCSMFNVQAAGTFGLQCMAQDSLVFFALFKNIRAWADQLCRPTLPPSAIVQTYHDNAVTQIRQRIATTTAPQGDTNLLYAIALLAMHERERGNLGSYNLHWTAFCKLLGMRYPAVNHSKHGNLATNAMKWALPPDDDFQPSNQLTTAPPLSKDPALPDIQAVPQGFQHLIQRGEISHATVQVLIRAANHFFDTNKSPTAHCNCVPLVTARRPPTTYLEACICLSYPDPSLDRLICLALTHLKTLCCINRPWRYFMYMARLQLTLGLGELRATEQPLRDCILWLYLVAIHSWRSHEAGATLMGDGGSVLVDFQQRFTTDEVTWDHVEDVLKRFRWTILLEDWWREKWNTLIEI